MMYGLVVVLLALASACGGGGNGDERASATAIEPEAQQRAESINLTLADFPNGWRASAREADDSIQDEFNKCVGVDYSELTRIGHAESKEFAQGESTEARSEVAIFKDEQQAEEALREHSEGLGGATAEDCFQKLIEESFKEAGRESDRFELGEVDVGELSFTPPEVDEAKAWQIVVPVEITEGAAKGLEPNVYVEEVVLREGDAVAVLITQDVLTEFDREQRDELIQTLAGRMSQPVA